MVLMPRYDSGYWQVELDPEDGKKTVFTFGLCNAPATFERLVEIVLAGFP